MEMMDNRTETEPPAKYAAASKSEQEHPNKRGAAVVVSQEAVAEGPPEKRPKSALASNPAFVTEPEASTPSTAATTSSELFPHYGDETPTSRDDGAAAASSSSTIVVQDAPISKSPPGAVQEERHAESVSSDLSSASAATADDRRSYRYDTKEDLQERATCGNSAARHRSLSPNPAFRVPPAPPSTPASQHGVALSFSFDGMADFLGPPTLTSIISTPIAPLLGGGSYVRNADLLELKQQQQQQQLLDGGVTPAPPKQDTVTSSTASACAAMAATPKPSAAAGAATPKPGDSVTASSAPLPEDFSDWAVGDRYELVRILGRGSYGEVAQAIDLTKTTAAAGSEESAYVAIKRIQSPFDQQLDAVRLYREIHILRRMKEGGEGTAPSCAASTNPPTAQRHHDCIIQLLDVVQPPALDDFNDLYLVFEYVDTDLYKLIMSPQYLTTEHIQTFLYQILCAIKWIHSFSVFHRDLKPANILLNEDCSLKICDFGLARIVGSDTMPLARHGDATKAKVVDSLETPKGSRVKTARGVPSIPKTNLTRQLTKHVVTRWYRAPELILIQPYTSAVDIWSIGCIFAELLSMQEGNVPGYQDRKPLFPGGTCYPLSGEGDSIKADERLDQLSVIFSVIGTPSPEDIEASGKANEYIAALPKTKGKPLETLYPAADPAAIDLLKKMLYFNPKRRVTAEEALEHEFFKGVRRIDLERTADGPLEGPDFLESDNIDIRVLKQRTYEEVLWYRDHGGKKVPSTAEGAAKNEE